MAKKVTVEIVDDFDGSASAEAVEFSFRGKDYTIDLNKRHIEDFEDVLAPYIEHGSRVGGRPTHKSTSRTRKDTVDGLDSAAIRDWAIENHLMASRRGRIPKDVREKYKDWLAENAAKQNKKTKDDKAE